MKKETIHKRHLHSRIHHKIKKNLTWVKKKLEGFTLIELLIVIAIIGILATVVLGSLNAARLKGADAGIKSDLNNMRTQASIWYDDNGQVYATSGGTAFGPAQCPSTASTGNIFADPKIFSAISGAYGLSGGIANSRCVATVREWAVAIQLRTSDGAGASNPAPDAWCVDSLGSAHSVSYATGETIANVIEVNTNKCL